MLDIDGADALYMLIEYASHIHPSISELIHAMLGEIKPLEQFSVKSLNPSP